MAKDKIILGIDPGTNLMGYGLIHCHGKNDIKLLSLGVIKLGKYDNHAIKLKKIFERVLSIIDEFHPDELSVEAPFHGKNVQSMLKLGRAQGVAMAAALYRDIPIAEYAPKKIKQSITGSGNASKEQVAAMLNNILKEDIQTNYLDATDGLAAAVCHHYQITSPILGTSTKNWESFINNNPDRVIK